MTVAVMKKEALKQCLHIIMNSDVRYLQMVESASSAVLQILKINEDTKFKINMAIREAVINAIYHGNKNNVKKRVEIVYAFTHKKLEISVKDEGNGFNYKSLPDPTKKENLLKPFGRGIFFIKSFMDKVSFCHEPDKGLTLKMIKNL